MKLHRILDRISRPMLDVATIGVSGFIAWTAYQAWETPGLVVAFIFILLVYVLSKYEPKD